MRTRIRIEGIARQWQGNEVVARLTAIVPEGRLGSDRHMFRADLPIEDSRVEALLEVLQEAGLMPWTDKARMPNRKQEYVLSYRRVYEPAELAAAEYLELYPGPVTSVDGDRRAGARTITMIEEPGKADICMVGLKSHAFVAVQRARDVLEAANLKGLHFLPVEKAYESVDYDLFDEEDTWWELESDLQLPPLSPSMNLETRDGRPFTGDFADGCLRRDGLYTYAELHYRRSDLERFGPFDAARTYEQFHSRGPAPSERALVVSQKFYQTCVANNINARFVPVRIDEA